MIRGRAHRGTRIHIGRSQERGLWREEGSGCCWQEGSPNGVSPNPRRCNSRKTRAVGSLSPAPCPLSFYPAPTKTLFLLPQNPPRVSLCKVLTLTNPNHLAQSSYPLSPLPPQCTCQGPNAPCVSQLRPPLCLEAFLTCRPSSPLKLTCHTQ